MNPDLSDPTNPVVVAALTHRCGCGAQPGVPCESITGKPFPDLRLIHFQRVQQWDIPESEKQLKVTINLSKREAEAILRSEGFTNGWGIRKSQSLQSAEAKVVGAIQHAWNASLEDSGE